MNYTSSLTAQPDRNSRRRRGKSKNKPESGDDGGMLAAASELQGSLTHSLKVTIWFTHPVTYGERRADRVSDENKKETIAMEDKSSGLTVSEGHVLKKQETIQQRLHTGPQRCIWPFCSSTYCPLKPQSR